LRDAGAEPSVEAPSATIASLVSALVAQVQSESVSDDRPSGG
jgi:hypothetical protein